MYNEDKLNEAIKGLSENHLLRLNEFAFEKLVHLWDKWKQKTINPDMLDKLIGLEYQDFLNLANENASVKEIKDLIFRIVAYCDLNANNKAVLNEYDDKRTIAKCGIRQNAWVAQLLKFKKDVNLVKDSLINVIQYIENPENHYPIVSEEHKKCIYNYFIGDGKYSKDTFGDSLNMFFDGKTNFQFAKPSNKTNLYSDIIYAMKDEWMENNVVAFTKIIDQTTTEMNNFISETTEILKLKKNIILQGAPGTGKTYNTAALALSILGVDTTALSHGEIMKEYDKLLEKQIFFTTFHQSMDYEDFIEGIKPEVLNNGTGVKYNIEDGILKKSITKAEGKPVVIIIDEINRGNVSKIFGELITLVEADKRIDSSNGNNHHLSVILPYSKRSFGIPENVYFIGTMNTTDRSTGTIDYALRRRFAFVTLTSDREILNGIKNDSAREFALQKFDIVKDFIVNNKTSDFDIDDLMVGHSYFLSESVDELRIKLKYEVVPLLKEYMKDGIIRNNEETKRFVMSLLD